MDGPYGGQDVLASRQQVRDGLYITREAIYIATGCTGQSAWPLYRMLPTCIALNLREGADANANTSSSSS